MVYALYGLTAEETAIVEGRSKYDRGDNRRPRRLALLIDDG